MAVLIPLRIVGQNSKRLELKQNIWSGQTIILVFFFFFDNHKEIITTMKG